MSAQSKKNKVNLAKWMLFLVTILLTLVFLFYLFIRLGLFGKIPNEKELAEISNYTASEIFTYDNVLLGRYYVENRTNIDFNEIPDFLVKALIATEDARFYKHKGVDGRSTLRVIIKSLLLFNSDAGGGSTLTQQLAKNLFPRKRLGIFTLPVAKIKEITIAQRLEKVYTKSEIIELYLNTVPFGENTFGIETAALVYFNKKTNDLLPEECALLVGMLKGNELYNPRKNPKLALNRRNLVLNQMVKYEQLNSKQAKEIKARKLQLNYHKIRHDEGLAPYFREYLRHYLQKWANDHPKPDGTYYNIYTDGLKIYTTLDSRLQQYAEKAVNQHMDAVQKTFDAHWKGKEPWKKNPMMAKKEILQSQIYQQLAHQYSDPDEISKKMKIPVNTRIYTPQGDLELKLSPLDSVLYHFAKLQAGLLTVEANTGYIKAWVGGLNYKFFKYDHVTAQRQAGSTFKPILYAAALENGTKPCDYFKNDSTVYTQYNNWVPRNAERNYGGYYSMNGALTHSINTVSVKILMNTGFDKVVNLSRKMGLEGDIPKFPSMALGSGTVSVFELAAAYSVFLNKGKRVMPVMVLKIEDQNGNLLYTNETELKNETLITEESASAMIEMLKNVVNNGTALALRNKYGFTNELAGKTGTTQNHADGWFLGLTPDLITAVWVGGDNPEVRFRTLGYGQGAYLALPIFANYLKSVYNNNQYKSLQNSTFNLSEGANEWVNCPDYREEPYGSIQEYLDEKKETIKDFIHRIFSK